MIALAWYTTVFVALSIIALILTMVGLLPPPPLTPLELIATIILMVPLLILGILLIIREI